MLNIRKVDHVGIRVSDKDRSVEFYGQLGFALVADAGFDQGHPVILRHPSGVVLNLLGPSTTGDGANILMDVPDKHPGYTHIALRVESLEEAKTLFAAKGFEITGGFSFKNMTAVFIRDPDSNVIEFDEYSGEAPEADAESEDDFAGYSSHP